MTRTLFAALFAVSTAGCETSAAWYFGHPDRKIVTVDGVDVSVVPRRANEFDAFGGEEGTATNTARLKARQIRAIEEVSGCKVTAAEYMNGGYMVLLQAVVACRDTVK